MKFYRRSFFDVVEDEVGGFEGFNRVIDWVPQRLVTATGPTRSRGDVRLPPGYKTARWASAPRVSGELSCPCRRRMRFHSVSPWRARNTCSIG